MTLLDVIGREPEKLLLDDIIASSSAELVAVYGRRRVGKTYLIKSYLKQQLIFEYSGIHNITTDIQLANFTGAMAAQLNEGLALQIPKDWFAAFGLLATLLKTKLRRKKMVIFLDEFPWMQTPKSNFMAAFENFWNTWAVDKPNLVCILCGSAASWMIQNVLRNKGGLHNRITRKIPLAPFSLHETEAFLMSRQVFLDRYQIIQLYMALGGVPHYLKQVKPGMSAAQVIDAACFSKNGFLHTEFDDLFRALFDTSDRHMKVVRTLAAKPIGLTRNELIKACKLQSGGSTTKLLDDLTESGFITPCVPWGKLAKDSIYKLTDEYARFYIKFIEPNRAGGKGTWMKLAATPSWKSWSGLAFEVISQKHTDAIKMALGISGIYTSTAIWKGKAGRGAQSVQIDLLLDRQDYCINICEMKFYAAPFVIDKKYAAELQQKLHQFKLQTNTRKQLFLTMVTCFGIEPNIYATGLVQHTVTANDLFLQKQLRN
jgi:uncharacterized protein